MNDFSSKVSAIILSGGNSSRMGVDKCDLDFNGETFLNNQINKMKQIGIEDVIAAGYRGNKCKSKVVADSIMKGPLSGIYVGLNEIKNDRAFVVSVDMPLLMASTIKKIVDYSLDNDFDIVLAKHNGTVEQLIGVFKKNLKDKIQNILQGDRYSVMKLIDDCKVGHIELNDNDDQFKNVNYQSEYKDILSIKN